MSDTKPRGRPPTGTALSTADRTRRLHDKAMGALDTVDISHFPDSALLLAMSTAYRTRHLDGWQRITGELSRRLRLSVDTTDNPTDSVDTTLNQPISIPVESTETATGFYTNGITVDTTDIQPVHILVETTRKASDTDTVEATDIPDSLLVETTTSETPLTVETTDNAEPFTLATAAPTEPLSARDAEILARYAAGEKKRPIARQMGISDGTVRNVLTRHGID
jgi:DNA-binding NarL/FixJ family response regulator